MPTVDFSTNTVDYGSFCSLTVTLTLPNTTLSLGSVTFPYTFDPTDHGLDEHYIDGTYVFDCNGCEFTRVVEYTPPPQTAVYRMNLCCTDGYEGNPTTYSLIELPNTYSTGDVISIYGVCYTVDTEFNAVPQITPNPSDIFPFDSCSKCLSNENTINCNNTTTSTTTIGTTECVCTEYNVTNISNKDVTFLYTDCDGNPAQEVILKDTSTTLCICQGEYTPDQWLTVVESGPCTTDSPCLAGCSEYRVRYQPQGLAQENNQYSYTNCNGESSVITGLIANDNNSYVDVCICGNPIYNADYQVQHLNDDCVHLGDE